MGLFFAICKHSSLFFPSSKDEKKMFCGIDRNRDNFISGRANTLANFSQNQGPRKTFCGIDGVRLTLI